MSCVQQTANYKMEDRQKGVSPAKSIDRPRGFWDGEVRASHTQAAQESGNKTASTVRKLTEPTLQLNAAYLGADVSHGSMPVSTPNTSARREAQVSFQEPSDLTTEQRTANMMSFQASHDSANDREITR